MKRGSWNIVPTPGYTSRIGRSRVACATSCVHSWSQRSPAAASVSPSRTRPAPLAQRLEVGLAALRAAKASGKTPGSNGIVKDPVRTRWRVRCRGAYDGSHAAGTCGDAGGMRQ